jgi:uncharacterized repeat protein (TIGR03803 family)
MMSTHHRFRRDPLIALLALAWMFNGMVAGNAASPHPASPQYHETVLYRFTGGPDGAHPCCNLVTDASGALYGTTTAGGPQLTECFMVGCGTVFRLEPTGSGYAESTLAGLQGSDGSDPIALTASGNTLLGEALDQSGFMHGALFALTPDGIAGNYFASAIHDFTGKADGAVPVGGLTPDGTGSFLGAATRGGQDGGGVIFRLSPPKSGASRYYGLTVAYYFTSGLTLPASGVVFGKRGEIYGVAGVTNSANCPSGENCGGVYALVPTSTGYTEHVIHLFGIRPGDVMEPSGNLLAKQGGFFGTTLVGGLGEGTVYQVTGNHRYHRIYVFQGPDGAYPTGSLIADNTGTLYGTTSGGGAYGKGTVFRLTPRHGVYFESVIWSFGSGADGANPSEGLVADSSGALYGATTSGGSESAPSGGFGTIFRLAP